MDTGLTIGNSVRCSEGENMGENNKMTMPELPEQCRTCEHLESWHMNIGDNCAVLCDAYPRSKRASGWIDGVFYCDLWVKVNEKHE